MIYVRDDDVLVGSSSYADPHARFVGVHRIIVEGGAVHRPSIIVKSIQEFPATIDFIREKTEQGEMEPQWHGWDHVDYAKIAPEQIEEEIQRSQDLFKAWFNVHFTKFYTPWGANASHIKETCEKLGIEMVDCSALVKCVHINREPEKFRGQDIEIMIHWWEGVGRLVEALRNLHA